MKRPTFKGKDQIAYVDYLEKKLERFSATNTKVKSFATIKDFIDKSLEALKKVQLDPSKLTDKDDKATDRALKIFKDLGGLNETLDALAAAINPEELTGPETKYLKASGISLEQLIDEGRI